MTEVKKILVLYLNFYKACNPNQLRLYPELEKHSNVKLLTENLAFSTPGKEYFDSYFHVYPGYYVIVVFF